MPPWLIPAAMTAAGAAQGFFAGQAADKQTQLGREQFDFQRGQVLKQGDIASRNVARMDPLLMQLIMRGVKRNTDPREQGYKLQPPTINNPYSVR